MELRDQESWVRAKQSDRRCGPRVCELITVGGPLRRTLVESLGALRPAEARPVIWTLRGRVAARALSDFDRRLASGQKVQATIMKQRRLFAEEQLIDDPRREGRGGRQEKGKNGKGMGRAKEIALRGSALSAEEAVRIGLATELAPRAELRERAHALALELSRLSPVAYREAKMGLHRGLNTPMEDVWQTSSFVQASLLTSDDFRERLAAVRAGKPPPPAPPQGQ